MKNDISESFTFLPTEKNTLETSIFYLNFYLNGFIDAEQKPYKIDYHTLLMSYQMWGGKDLDEFCHKQTISHFLFNPNDASEAAREAFFLEIREFLSKK